MVVSGSEMENLSKLSLEKLIEKFSSPKWFERRQAALAVANNYGVSALPKLKEVIEKRENEDKVFWAINTLAYIGTPEAFKLLVRYAKDSAATVRQWTATALGKVKAKESAKILISMLEDEDWLVCNEAVRSLIVLEDLAFEEAKLALKKSSYNKLYWLFRYFARGGNQGVKLLIRVLSFSESRLKAMAAEALSESENPAVIRYLVKALLDPVWSVREAVTDALAKMGEMIVEPILVVLKEGKEELYIWVKKVLDRLGRKKLRPLIELLSHPDSEMRILAAHFLGESGYAEAIKPLIERLKDSVWLVKKEAAKALVRLGGKAVEDLVNALWEATGSEIYWITSVLGEIGEESVPALINLIKSDKKLIRKHAAIALGETRDERAVRALIEALGDPEWIVRSAAAESLKKLGPVVLIELLRYIQLQDENIRFWAKRVLEDVGPRYPDVLLNKLIHGNREERQLAAYGLSMIRYEKATDKLIDVMLNDTDEWVRRYAATALGKIGTPIAIDSLIVALEAESFDFSLWVASVLAENPDEFRIERMREVFKSDSPMMVAASIYFFFKVLDVSELAKVEGAPFKVGGEYTAKALLRCANEDIEKFVMWWKEAEDVVVKDKLGAVIKENPLVLRKIERLENEELRKVAEFFR